MQKYILNALAHLIFMTALSMRCVLSEQLQVLPLVTEQGRDNAEAGIPRSRVEPRPQMTEWDEEWTGSELREGGHPSPSKSLGNEGRVKGEAEGDEAIQVTGFVVFEGGRDVGKFVR